MEFVNKLRELNAKNSQLELSIEKFLTKREEEFFDKAREDKRSSAASLKPQHGSFYNSNVSWTSFYSTRPDCTCPILLMVHPCSCLVPAPSFGDEAGVLGGGEDSESPTLVTQSRLQVFLSREVAGLPIYTIILSIGQVRCSSVMGSRAC